MRQKQITMLQYLATQRERVTSEVLAQYVGVSVRTVKSYIAEINLEFPKLILSSNRGYKVNPEQAARALKMKDHIPQDYESRCVFLVKRALLDRHSSVNVFDLCEELFVSFSTLKSDIAKMNTTFAGFNLTFTCTDSKFQIVGSESDKRRLVTHVMSEEVSGQFLDLTFIQDSFPEYRVDIACEQIRNLIRQNDYYVNDFSFINLVLHIMIMVIRIQNGNHTHKNEASIDLHSESAKIVEQLCQFLGDFFSISFNNEDKQEIQLLLKANNGIQIHEAADDTQALVPEDIWNEANDLVTAVNNHFYVDLTSNDFLTPFTLHLKSLRNRIRAHSVVRNPMWESLKLSCPTIYDIATFMAYQLGNFFGAKLSEDEIGFLALHVGTEIERQKRDEVRVSAAILCPHYLGIRDSLYKNIIDDFSGHITIKKFAALENEVPTSGIDLLITTVPVQPKAGRTDVLLPPFSANYDASKISAAIQAIEEGKKVDFLADNFDLYFSKSLFMYVQEPLRQADILKELGNSMIALRYVEPDFLDEIWKRERASSTAFMKVAIPHPMKMNALRTSVAIAIVPRGVEWSSNHVVNVVCMTAFNRMDNQNFHKVYEILIDLFNRPDFMANVQRCKTFADFKTAVVDYYRG